MVRFKANGKMISFKTGKKKKKRRFTAKQKAWQKQFGKRYGGK